MKSQLQCVISQKLVSFQNISKIESSKLNLLEKLIEKIVEFDRLVLKKTAPETIVPQRRGSRGSDLSTLPTHLHITDRLLDLFTQSQRVTVIRTTVGGNCTANNVCMYVWSYFYSMSFSLL